MGATGERGRERERESELVLVLLCIGVGAQRLKKEVLLHLVSGYFGVGALLPKGLCIDVVSFSRPVLCCLAGLS